MRVMARQLVAVGVLAAGLAGCAFVPDVTYREDVASPRAEPTSDGFCRYDGYDNVAGTFETSAVTYRKPGSDVSVTLLGAIHIGDAGYYAEVQRRLDAGGLVLFELVKPEFYDPTKHAPSSGGMYGEMARTIGLAEQMAHVDLRRDHFRWLDMSSEQFDARVQAVLGEAVERLGELRGDGAIGMSELGRALLEAPPALQRAWALMGSRVQRARGGAALSAMANPLDAAMSLMMQAVLMPLSLEKAVYRQTKGEKAFEDKYKHMMADGLLEGEQAAGLEQLRGQSAVIDLLVDTLERLGAIILEERNVILADGIEAAASERGGAKDIVVWYGAGHYPGVEQLLADMGWKRVGEPQWIPAIAIEK
jgi:hypothetical protein